MGAPVREIQRQHLVEMSEKRELATKSPQRMFSDMRSPTSIVLAAILGFAGALIFNLRSRGIVSAGVAGAPLEGAIVLLTMLFFVELIWPLRGGSPLGRLLRAMARSGICSLVIASTWSLGTIALPDSARIYFLINRSYIDKHWVLDPVSELTYFPIDAYELDRSGSAVPLNFFVMDKEKKLKVDPLSHEVTSPSCPGAQYTAEVIRGQIYVLRHYTIAAGAALSPCLITPVRQTNDG